jgi:hypothetical protein
MPAPVKPYTFVDATDILADEVNADFDALFDWAETEAIRADAGVAFSAIPSGPATNPTSDNEFSRKAYVDAGDKLRIKLGHTGAQTGLVGGATTLSSIQPLIQCGEDVTVTSAAGGITISYPTAFPNGVLAVVVCNGDEQTQEGDTVALIQGNHVKSSFGVRWHDAAGDPVVSASRRTAWIAIGW